MKRNSHSIFIETQGCISILPWVDGSPDFSRIAEPSLSILMSAYEANKGNIEIVPDPLPPVLPPDWDKLLNRLLSGDLHPLFQGITLAAFSNPFVLIARNDIYGALSNPNISDRVGALRSGLNMLIQSGFEVTGQHKLLWNNALSELNFDPILFLE